MSRSASSGQPRLDRPDSARGLRGDGGHQRVVVPWRLIGERVRVVVSAGRVRVYHDRDSTGRRSVAEKRPPSRSSGSNSGRSPSSQPRTRGMKSPCSAAHTLCSVRSRSAVNGSMAILANALEPSVPARVAPGPADPYGHCQHCVDTGHRGTTGPDSAPGRPPALRAPGAPVHRAAAESGWPASGCAVRPSSCSHSGPASRMAS